MTATLTPTTFLTARYTVNDTPYGDIPFGPNLKHDSTSLVTPAHNDLFTGVAIRQRHVRRRDPVAARRRLGEAESLHFGRSRISHNIRFGVQAARNRSFTQTVTPGGVVYQDQNGAPFQAAVHAAQHRRVAIHGVTASGRKTR